MIGVGEVADTACAALGADGLVVLDTRADRVVAVGPGAAVLADAVGEITSSAWTHGEHRIRSVDLPDSAGGVVGALHVGWRESDGDGALVRAFAGHLGLALSRRESSARTTPARPDDDLLPWDDPERLPDATRRITGQITELLRPLTGARAVGVTVWDPERRILRALPGAFGSDDDVLAASMTGPVTNMRSASSRVLACGAPYVSNDAGADPGVLQPYAEVFRIGRLLSVPLEGRCRRVGVLHLANKPSDFTLADVDAVEALAPRLAAAVDLAGTVERMAAQQRLEGVLTTTAVAVASGVAVQECLCPAFDRLLDELEAAVVALVPLTRDAVGLEPLIRRSGPPTTDEVDHRLLVDARDLATTASGAFPRQVGDPGWAALHTPVELHGERAATLAVLRRTGRPFTTQEEDVIGRLAQLVALAWTTERYQRQLAEIARLRERERIADGLHDRVAQVFFAAGLGLDSALEDPAGALDGQRLVEVRGLLAHGDAIVREVIHRLDGAPTSGLARRLWREVEAVEDEFGIAVHVEVPPESELAAVPRAVADAAVRVAREGTVNAAKHAGPCRIVLRVGATATELSVGVVDDGLIEPEAPARSDAPVGHGLSSLRRTVADAGGTLALGTTVDGYGTRLQATFPL